MTNNNYTNGGNSGLHVFLPELITSLLYASAISSMLSLSMNIEHAALSIKVILDTALIIFLVFADWNNRILIPLQFPSETLNEQRKPLFQYTKLVSEIISMVLLVIFYSYFIKNNYSVDKIINIYFMFALYLIACGVWNLIMIRIMKGIDLVPLLKCLLKGNVFDLQELEDFTKNFSDNFRKKEEKLNINYNVERGILGQYQSVKKLNKGQKKILREVNLARMLAQFIANHIIWLNLWISMMLIITTLYWASNLEIIEDAVEYLKLPISINMAKIILLLIVGMILFGTILCSAIDSALRKCIFGISMIAFLLIFYSCFAIGSLIYIMITQQIIIGLSIQYIVDGKKTG